MNKEKLKALLQTTFDEIATQEQMMAFHYNHIRKLLNELNKQIMENSNGNE